MADPLPKWVPLNWVLISNPLNWGMIVLMVLLGSTIICILSGAFAHANQGAEQ